MIKKNVNPAYLLFFLASIGYFVKYGLNVFLAHHLKDDMYGNYSIAIKLLAIFVTLSLFGTNISANRFLANYLQLNKKVKAADFIAWNIKLTSVTFTISCILGFFTFGLMILLHFFGIHNIQQYHLSIYMLWVVPISAIATQLTSFALCEQRFYRSTFFSQVLQYALMLFFFMLVTLLLGWKLTNVTIVAVIFASYLTLAVIIFIFMKIEMVLMIKAGLKNIFMPLSADNAWLKVSSRLIANTMVFKILSVSDLIIVLLLVKSGLEVGHYAAVLMIISSIWLIPQNLYREVKPKISSLIETAHGRAQLQEKLDRVNIVVFL